MENAARHIVPLTTFWVQAGWDPVWHPPMDCPDHATSLRLHAFPTLVSPGPVPSQTCPERHDFVDGVLPAASLSAYLATADQHLAEAPEDIRSWAPDARWVTWWRVSKAVPVHGGLMPFTDLASLQAEWEAVFGLRVFIEDMKLAVEKALSKAPADVLDATRLWTTVCWSPGVVFDSSLVPAVLLAHSPQSLANPRRYLPPAYTRLTHAQWERGAVLHRRLLKQHGRGDDLLSYTRSLVDDEEARRLCRLAKAKRPGTRHRL